MCAPSTASGTSPAMPPWGWSAMWTWHRCARWPKRITAACPPTPCPCPNPPPNPPNPARPPRPRPVRTPPPAPAQPGLRRIAVKAPAEQAYVALAFRVPGLARVQNLAEADRVALALQMLPAVLGGCDAARLERALTQGAQPVADSASSSALVIGRGPSLFLLSGVPAAG